MPRFKSPSVKGKGSYTQDREIVHVEPEKDKTVERSGTAAEKKLDELHKRFNLEQQENMKLETTTLMSMVVFENGAWEDGIEEFQGILKENMGNGPICRRAYDFIVRYNIENGNYREAIDQAKVLIDKYPTSTEAFSAKLNIGLCNEKTSQYEEANEVYKTLADGLVIEVEKEEADTSKIQIEKRARIGILYFRLGRSLLNQGKYQKSVIQFKEAFKIMDGVKGWPSVRISPLLYENFAEASFLMGQGYQKLKKNVDAKNVYQQVIEQYSDSKEWVDQAKDELSKME